MVRHMENGLLSGGNGHFQYQKTLTQGGDTSGKYCALKQSGPVWFLSGTFGGARSAYL